MVEGEKGVGGGRNVLLHTDRYTLGGGFSQILNEIGRIFFE